MTLFRCSAAGKYGGWKGVNGIIYPQTLKGEVECQRP